MPKGRDGDQSQSGVQVGPGPSGVQHPVWIALLALANLDAWRGLENVGVAFKVQGPQRQIPYCLD